MRINELTYGRKYNKGNFESEEVAVKACPESGESPNFVFSQMKKFVETRGAEGLEDAKAADFDIVIPETMEQTKPEKKKADEVKPTDIPLPPKPKAAPKQQKEAVAAAKAKPASVKSTPYDRSLDLHKKLLGELLDTNYKGWKANPSKAVSASASLEGKDFLDAEGLVLQSFKDLLAEAMK